jgi:hypothetical protein
MTTSSNATEAALGMPVTRHGRSRTAVVPLIAGIVVLLCSTAIPLALMSGAHVDPSNLPAMYGATAALVVLGLLMLLGWKLMGPKTLITLHEKGVAVHHRNGGRTDVVPFADMTDVYLFRTGGYTGGMINALAFRRSPDDAWVDVLENRRGSFALRAAIVDGYAIARLPIALRAVDAGEVVRFHAITKTSRLTKRLVGGFLKVDTYPVELSASGIVAGGERVSLDAIHDIAGADSIETVRFLDAHGKVVHAFDYLSLFSADLFIALVAELLNRRTPAYHSLLAH